MFNKNQDKKQKQKKKYIYIFKQKNGTTKSTGDKIHCLAAWPVYPAWGETKQKLAVHTAQEG